MKKFLILNRMTKIFFLFVAVFCLSIPVSGQFSIVSVNSLLSVDDFDSFNGSGFAPSPALGQLDSDTWSTTGWSNGDLDFGETETTAMTDFTRGTDSNSVTTGGVYAFDIGTGDFTLGAQPGGSDFTPGDFRLALVNDTGTTITSLTLSYSIAVYNDQARGNSFNFSYGSDNVSYASISSLDFTSGEAADGSPTWVTTTRNATIAGLSIASGSNYYFKWEGGDVSGSGNRDQFGLNDVIVGANMIPEPSTYALIFGGIALGVVVWKRRRTAT